jgi:maltose O-acetyltransferase
MSRRSLRVDLLRSLSSMELLPHRFRPVLLRWAGVTTGPRVHILAGLQLSGHADVVLGEGVFVNVDCFIDAQADVTIGDHVSLGDHVRLITSTHRDGSSRKRAGTLTGRPVSIGSGTWIGSGTTVLPGVNVGAGCVIAAGSMVTEDCEPDSLYAGVPARLKRRLT